jgi:hypothetical protein
LSDFYVGDAQFRIWRNVINGSNYTLTSIEQHKTIRCTRVIDQSGSAIEANSDVTHFVIGNVEIVATHL